MTIDRSIPGYPEIGEWPDEPKLPLVVDYLEILRDGGTIVAELRDQHRQHFFFCFDMLRRRPIWGRHPSADDAAFVTLGSPIATALFDALLSAQRSHATKVRN